MKKLKLLSGIFVALALLVSSFVSSEVNAATTWDVDGSYVANFNYLGSDHPHDVVLVQDASDNLSGHGGSPAGGNVYTWVITSGSVSSNTIDFMANYTATADAVTPQTVMHVVGTIANDGSMSGTWSDNYQGSSRDGTWATTSGVATEADNDVVVVSADTSAGENKPGWLFNRDTSTDTPIAFNTTQASIGTGSLNILPIGANAADKFVGENFLNAPIANVDSVSYDFRIGSGGDNNDEEQFYMNVYADFGVSADTKFYDCRYDVVPTTGSTSAFTTVTFDPTQSYPVTQSGSSPFACPSVPAQMDTSSAGSTIRAFALNVGDTSTSDVGLDGYLDNVIVVMGANSTTYDFEPAGLAGTLNAEDFGVVDYDTGATGQLSGYTAGFGVSDNTFAGATSVVVKLYGAGDTLLQTNTAILSKFNVDVTGTQFSSPFDVSGDFDYALDGYWTNVRASQYGQSVPATKVVATVTLANGKVVTATNTNLSGDPTTIYPEVNDNTLTVSKAGTGSGTVTSTPAGINCGADCSETFSSDTSVTLSAVAASGSTFTGWSGACSGTGSCVVLVDSAKAVTATFTLNTVSGTPTDKDQCKGNGWKNFTNPSFKNQGQCVAFTNHN